MSWSTKRTALREESLAWLGGARNATSAGDLPSTSH